MSTPVLAIELELDYENRAVDWDKNISHGRKKLEIIYKEWSFEVAKRFESEKKDLHTVCAHMKGRLRFRGCSEGSIDYIAECLPKEFKDPRFDSSPKNKGRDGNPSLVYEDVDELCMNIHYKSDHEKLTIAEKIEILPRAIDLKKAKIKQLREEIENHKTDCIINKIPIPETQKISAPIPPDYFHGQSEYYFAIEDTEIEVAKLLNQIKDLKQRVYYFQPEKELAAACAAKWKEFHQGKFKKLRFVNTLMLKSLETIMTPYTDLKWDDNMTNWLQTADDRNEKYGDKGCGTKHAVPTGLLILKKYKDGTTDLVELLREKTKENVGDKSKEQLIKQALVICKAHEAEQSMGDWYTKTELIEEVSK